MKPRYGFTVALLSSVLISGCGQKGPLFLPGDPTQIQMELPELDRDMPPDDANAEDESESAEPATGSSDEERQSVDE
jgi:predicted small lipoprotein YifL